MSRRRASGFNRFYRDLYRARRNAYTLRTWASGNPRRIARMYTRRAAYRAFSRFLRMFGL
jgi:hypothetical protein